MRRYNWKPDRRDHRDRLMKIVSPRPLPHAVDLRPGCSAVFDQGNEGSCTAQAGAGLIEYLQLAELKKGLVGEPQELGGAQFAAVSRQFIYWNEREIEGSTGEDAGAQIRDCVKALADFGVCREALWPYDAEKNLYVKPSDEAFAEAEKFKISSYARLTSLHDMKACLAEGFPFMFGIYVYASFESEAVAKTGLVPMPGENDECLGGHAVMCVGYDDAKGHVIMRNSWGPSWGDLGHFFLPYDFVQNPCLSSDFWCVRR